MQDSRTPAVSMRNITKTFGTITANKNVDLDIYRGEILSLLGENGSGKTTLMNMLSGIYFPDEGEIYIDGEPVVISSPKVASKTRLYSNITSLNDFPKNSSLK